MEVKPVCLRLEKVRNWGVKIPFVDIHQHPKMGRSIPVVTGNNFPRFGFLRSTKNLVRDFLVSVKKRAKQTTPAMKKLSGFLFGVAVLFLVATAHAQTQDTALARIDDKALVKKADDRLTKPTELSEDRAILGEVAAPQVKFIVPETKDRKSENSILESKAGPNGEDVQMDKNGYYYFDEAGTKVRTDVKGLRDKPKHS